MYTKFKKYAKYPVVIKKKLHLKKITKYSM